MRRLTYAVLLMGILLAMPSCNSYKITTGYENETIHPKTPMEWWVFSGTLTDNKNGDAYGSSFVLFHLWEEPSYRMDRYFINASITDIANEKFLFESAAVTFPKQGFLPEYPMKIDVPSKYKAWRYKANKNKYILKAIMQANEGYGMLLKCKKKDELIKYPVSGSEEFNRIKYYSSPVLSAKGWLRVSGKKHRVRGKVWYDRYWDCFDLIEKKLNWTQINIHISETDEKFMLLMLSDSLKKNDFRFYCTFTSENKMTVIKEEEIEIMPMEYWSSPNSGKKYPVKWKIELKQLNYELIVESGVKDQEFSMSNYHFYHGAAQVKGIHRGNVISGMANVKLIVSQ